MQKSGFRSITLKMLQRYSNFFLKNPKNVYNFPRVLLSTQPVTKEATSTSFDKHLNDLEGLSTTIKKRAKLPQREPFAKNLFIGKFDTELLAYPQLDKKDVEELERTSAILQDVFNKEQGTNIKELLNKLRSLKCLGLEHPNSDGGRELNTTEACKYRETLLDNKYKYALINNELSIFLLSKFGNEEQKAKYLPKLLDGTILSAIGIGDNSYGIYDRKAIANMDDMENYVLSGVKKNIYSANEADLYIILTLMSDSQEDSLNEMDLTCFLIDSNTPGVSIKENNTIDPNFNASSDVIFNNTKVSVGSILGKEREGREILNSILSPFHLNSSIVSLNISKKLLNHLSEDFLNKSTDGEELHKSQAVVSKLGQILQNTYVIESMIYFTSGLLSTYENQDCELECLITRALSSKLALESTKIGFEICGVSAIESNHFCQELHRQALMHFVSYETQDMFNILTALLGLQYAGMKLGDTVKKLRNPLFNGTFILKKLWSNRRQTHDEPALTLQLRDYLHLSCQDAANELEYSVLRLQYATEVFFGRHGIEILNKHVQQRRLAEVVTQIYAMSACLSRASRSYCIGLEHCEMEIILSGIVCKKAVEEVKKNIHDILYEFEMVDRAWDPLTEKLYRNKNYYFSHPLSRTF